MLKNTYIFYYQYAVLFQSNKFYIVIFREIEFVMWNYVLIALRKRSS